MFQNSAYEYINYYKNFNKTLLLEKEGFYNHLNFGDITDANYTPAKRVCRNFEIKNIREYHDLYVQSNTLLLADVFEKFQNPCLEIYKSNPAYFLTALELVYKAALKKAIVKLDLWTDVDMLLMEKKDIRVVICHAVYW